MEKTIIFATNNRHKLEEVAAFLKGEWQLITPCECGVTEDIPEEQPTVEGNALQKARYLYERTGKNCFADDTALEVDALGGEPGVRSARYAEDSSEGSGSEANMAKLMAKMEGKEQRTARFRTVIALILGGTEYLFEGVVEGEITEVREGGDGFGYDPIFRPIGYETTFAQMSMEDKNLISHRGRAVAKLVEFLVN
ncbi:MAG: RdgB/HAM1 family non-canonical purine NTP pyrophosphatase [Rikenellaceae bacterium]